MTRTDLARMIKTRQTEVDTKLLLHAIQKTAAFESLLSRRFSGVTLNTSRSLDSKIVKPDQKGGNNPFGDPDSSNNPFEDQGAANNPFHTADGEIESSNQVTVQNYQSINLTPFKGIISQCFEPYLHIYIEAQDKNMSDMISRFAADLSSTTVTKLDAGEGAPVLTSCGDLFVFYRKCLVQLAELSTGQPLLELAGLFKQYLREYTSKVIMAALPKIGTSTGSASSDRSLQLPSAMSQLSGLKDLSGLSQATTGILANFSALLKEGVSVRFSDSDQVIICSSLVTVEYCLDTTMQLETKMKQKVDQDLVDKINFTSEVDLLQVRVFKALASKPVIGNFQHLNSDLIN